jgi:hypothetical protein
VFSCVFATATHVAKVSSVFLKVDRPLLLGTHLPQPLAAATRAQTFKRGSGAEREQSPHGVEQRGPVWACDT